MRDAVRNFWEKWIWGAWLADPCIGRTSLAARGLWAEALNVMMASSTYELGGTPVQLARALRCEVAELIPAVIALAHDRVCDVHVHPLNGSPQIALTDVTPASNAVVTLVSRRRLKEYKARENSRLRQERRRCHTSVTDLSQECVTPLSNSNSNSISISSVNQKIRPEDEKEVVAYCQSLSLPASDGVAIWAKWEGNGFTNNGKRMKDWKATIRSWKGYGYLPSQKNNGFKPRLNNHAHVKPKLTQHDRKRLHDDIEEMRRDLAYAVERNSTKDIAHLEIAIRNRQKELND